MVIKTSTINAFKYRKKCIFKRTLYCRIIRTNSARPFQKNDFKKMVHIDLHIILLIYNFLNFFLFFLNFFLILFISTMHFCVF